MNTSHLALAKLSRVVNIFGSVEGEEAKTCEISTQWCHMTDMTD